MYDEDGTHRCFACGKIFTVGEAVYEDVNEGTMHAACCGPEPESFVDAEGEPLKCGDPIPNPHPYQT